MCLTFPVERQTYMFGSSLKLFGLFQGLHAREKQGVESSQEFPVLAAASPLFFPCSAPFSPLLFCLFWTAERDVSPEISRDCRALPQTQAAGEFGVSRKQGNTQTVHGPRHAETRAYFGGQCGRFCTPFAGHRVGKARAIPMSTGLCGASGSGRLVGEGAWRCTQSAGNLAP